MRRRRDAADAIGSASVKFETSCAPPLKTTQTRLALLHSFWFPKPSRRSRPSSRRRAMRDGTLGHRARQWGNPFAGIKPARTVELTKASIDKAGAAGSPTPRERAYIAAVAQLVTAADPGSHAARIGAYETAMEKVSRDNPADVEGRIFYALAVAQTAAPTDKTYANNLKAAGILEPLFKQMPTHPGLAHYIIHAYDAPPLAEKALVAARKYASLAPAIPHALHMPSTPHPRRILEESVRHEPPVGGRGEEKQRVGGGTARARLPDVRVPADRAGHGRQGGARSRDRGRAGGDRAGQLVRDCRHPGALCARARQLDGSRRADGPSGENAVHGGDNPLRTCARRARSGNPKAAHGHRAPHGPAGHVDEIRMRTGVSRWTSSAASRWRGDLRVQQDGGLAQLSAAGDAYD